MEKQQDPGVSFFGRALQNVGSVIGGYTSPFTIRQVRQSLSTGVANILPSQGEGEDNSQTKTTGSGLKKKIVIAAGISLAVLALYKGTQIYKSVSGGRDQVAPKLPPSKTEQHETALDLFDRMMQRAWEVAKSMEESEGEQFKNSILSDMNPGSHPSITDQSSVNSNDRLEKMGSNQVEWATPSLAEAAKKKETWGHWQASL